MQKPTRHQDDLTAAAERALAAVETQPDSAPPHTDADEALVVALLELEAPARCAIFPGQVLPNDARIIPYFEFCEARWRRETYLESVLALYTDLGPEVGAWLTSDAVIDRIMDVAADQAVALAQIPREAADNARERYMRLVAMELVDVEPFAPHARILAVTAPAMLERARASQKRRADHHQAEIERIAREQREADEVIAAAERRERETIAAFFSARGAHIFHIGHRQFAGSSCAAIARGEAARDGDGYFATDHAQMAPSLSALALAMKKAIGAEAVTA